MVAGLTSNVAGHMVAKTRLCTVFTTNASLFTNGGGGCGGCHSLLHIRRNLDLRTLLSEGEEARAELLGADRVRLVRVVLLEQRLHEVVLLG
jgi:hypothetical protein